MDIQKLKMALQKATARGRVALIGHDAPKSSCRRGRTSRRGG